MNNHNVWADDYENGNEGTTGEDNVVVMLLLLLVHAHVGHVSTLYVEHSHGINLKP